MNYPFSIFLALKYLRPKRTFISIVTVISILGVMLGVAVLIIVLSVMSGFDDMWRDKILGFNAHVMVTSSAPITEYGELIDEVSEVDGVHGAAPFIQGLAFIQSGEDVHTPFLRGIDPDREVKATDITNHMVAGDFFIDDEEVVIGRDLAYRLNVRVGDDVLVYSPRQFTKADELHLPEELTVAGVFEVGMWDFDMGYLLCSLDTARNLNNMEDGVHGLQVMTEDPFQAQRVAEQIREKLGPHYDVYTWMELNKQLFSALHVEKNMMFFLLIFITIVAAFSIMNTLITVAVQKTNEIGLLKSLGFSSGSIMRVFIWQGWVSGFAGLVCGTILGLVVLKYRNHLMNFLSYRLNMEIFPKALYQLNEIPARVSLSDIGLISITVMVICTLAGLIPAWRAAKLDPAEALRYE